MSKYIVCTRTSASFLIDDAAFHGMTANSAIVAIGLADEHAKEVAVIHGNVEAARAIIGDEFDVF